MENHKRKKVRQLRKNESTASSDGGSACCGGTPPPHLVSSSRGDKIEREMRKRFITEG